MVKSVLRVLFSVAILVPALALALWAWSGRENLTKHTRNVEVQVRDELVQDMVTEMRAVPGPVMGYYIGLDAVGGAAGLSSVLGLVGFVVWLRERSTVVQAGSGA